MTTITRTRYDRNRELLAPLPSEIQEATAHISSPTYERGYFHAAYVGGDTPHKARAAYRRFMADMARVPKFQLLERWTGKHTLSRESYERIMATGGYYPNLHPGKTTYHVNMIYVIE